VDFLGSNNKTVYFTGLLLNDFVINQSCSKSADVKKPLHQEAVFDAAICLKLPNRFVQRRFGFGRYA